MIIINDNDYSILVIKVMAIKKIKNNLKKMITLLLKCEVIKAIIIEMIKMLIITITIIVIIINNSNLQDIMKMM